MDPQIRRELRRQENESRRSAPVNGPATIGARSDTGNYDVTFVDGSVYPGKGVKVFNTAHSEGDIVVAIPRQDGYIALEGPKARPNTPNVLDDPCGKYLEGQIFSCPQPDEETPIDLWGLGMFVSGVGDFDKVRDLYLINLKTGASYFVETWDDVINGCVGSTETPGTPGCYIVFELIDLDYNTPVLRCQEFPPRFTPGSPPRYNDALYTLSIDPQRRPIVHLRHTRNCANIQQYDFDKYFRLEAGVLVEHPKDFAIKDWRNDLPDFRCKVPLKASSWVSFTDSRSFYWYAEELIGAYSRPVLLNAGVVKITVSKVSTPGGGDCLVGSGLTWPRKSVNARYVKTDDGPAELALVSIAAF